MCLAIIGKIAAIDNEFAIVDFGEGVAKKLSNKIAQAKAGDFVIVKGNLVLETVEKKEGKKLLNYQTVLLKKLHGKSKTKSQA